MRGNEEGKKKKKNWLSFFRKKEDMKENVGEYDPNSCLGHMLESEYVILASKPNIFEVYFLSNSSINRSPQYIINLLSASGLLCLYR